MQKRKLTFRMSADIKFNREITGNDYVSPGGYEMGTKEKLIQFDFCDYEGSIDKKDAKILHSLQKNPDYESFENLNQLTKNDLENITDIHDFYVYTGEPDEPGSDLEVEEILSVTFEVYNEENGKYEYISIKKEILDAYNASLAKKRSDEDPEAATWSDGSSTGCSACPPSLCTGNRSDCSFRPF